MIFGDVLMRPRAQYDIARLQLGLENLVNQVMRYGPELDKFIFRHNRRLMSFLARRQGRQNPLYASPRASYSLSAEMKGQRRQPPPPAYRNIPSNILFAVTSPWLL